MIRMAKYDNQQKTNTSTQIRNMYSDGISYMNIKFYNTNLSFNLAPFISKDGTGKSTYDFKNAQMTTVNFEGAFALYTVCKDIIDGKTTECDLNLQCSGGAVLSLKRAPGQDGQMETVFSLNKNNMIIPFRFATTDMMVIENGTPVTKRIESGLGAFMETIHGYLTGINADRHLDKLTEDFAASQQQRQQQGQQGGWQGGQNRRPYNNNGYRKQYPGQFQGQAQQPPQGPPQPTWQGNPQQNMSGYTLPN